MRRNLKITLCYDGHDFTGWQVQPGRPTIQGTLVSAIEQVTGEKTLPQGSGRTDAGVHALAQVATVAIESPIPLKNLGKALNGVLPRAIRVLEVEEAAADFHARKSARAKTYRYRIYRSEICPPFLARYVYHHPYPLDENSMMEAAPLVTGENDFTSFAAVDPEKKYANKERLPNGPRFASVSLDADTRSGSFSRQMAHYGNVRTIYSSAWQRSGEELVYTIRGSGFLHHMVRNLVGTFLMIGKGNLAGKDLKRILDLRDRSSAAATAPASGLFLVSVEY